MINDILFNRKRSFVGFKFINFRGTNGAKVQDEGERGVGGVGGGEGSSEQSKVHSRDK